jgi:hypothetical protein
MTVPAFDVPPDFWPDLLSRFWDKEPGVIKDPFSSPIATTDEIFSGIKEFSKRLVKGDTRIPPRFYLDGALARGDAANIFEAKDSDVNLEGYIHRLENDYPGEYGFIINGFQALEPVIWARFAALLSDLYKNMGFITGTALVDVLIGNYTRSFFGLHKDSMDVVTIVVSGRKKFLTWPYETFADVAGNPKNGENLQISLAKHDYAAKREEAVVVEGEPGDVIYWPRGYWHLAESDAEGSDGSNVSIAVGFTKTNSPLRGIAKMTDIMLHNQSSGQSLPAGIKQYGSTSKLLDQFLGLQDAALNNQQLQLMTRQFYLTWISKFGVEKVPDPLVGESLNGSDLFQACIHTPIVFVQEADKLLWAINGQSFIHPPYPNVIAMFEEINTGMPFTLGVMAERYLTYTALGESTRNADANTLKEIFFTLYLNRGIWKV